MPIKIAELCIIIYFKESVIVEISFLSEKIVLIKYFEVTGVDERLGLIRMIGSREAVAGEKF